MSWTLPSGELRILAVQDLCSSIVEDVSKYALLPNPASLHLDHTVKTWGFRHDFTGIDNDSEFIEKAIGSLSNFEAYQNDIAWCDIVSRLRGKRDSFNSRKYFKETTNTLLRDSAKWFNQHLLERKQYLPEICHEYVDALCENLRLIQLGEDENPVLRSSYEFVPSSVNAINEIAASSWQDFRSANFGFEKSPTAHIKILTGPVYHQEQYGPFHLRSLRHIASMHEVVHLAQGEELWKLSSWWSEALADHFARKYLATFPIHKFITKNVWTSIQSALLTRKSNDFLLSRYAELSDIRAYTKDDFLIYLMFKLTEINDRMYADSLARNIIRVGFDNQDESRRIAAEILEGRCGDQDPVDRFSI